MGVLFVAGESSKAIESFFVEELGINPKYLHSKLHLTVYHARRRLSGLDSYQEPHRAEVATSDLRFMVMAPGGENRRPELTPSDSHVGVRIRRTSSAIANIRELRSRFYKFETDKVLAGRSPSNHVRNAFGARSYQPHLTLIKPGSGLDSDLTKIGDAFRSAVNEIVFDKFVVRCRYADY